MQAPIRIPPAPGPPQMCKNCHTKPASPGYSHCGKTCAKAAKRGSTVPAPNSNGTQSGATCANCKVRPAYKSHRYCGKTCASIAARQSQPYSPPVIGYQGTQSPSHQMPQSPSYSGPYSPNGPPSGYPGFPPQGYGYQPAGPSGAGPYSPVPPGYPNPQGYKPSQPNGWPSPPPRRLSKTPNRHPGRRPAPAANFESEDEYPSESDDDRRRPNRQPIQRKQKGDDGRNGNDSGYPSSGAEQGGRGRGGDRRNASGRPETRRSQSETASSSRNDSLCIVCRRHPRHSRHQFCSKQCRDSLSLSQAQGPSQHSMGPGTTPGAYPGSSKQAGRSDGPPPYSDIED